MEDERTHADLDSIRYELELARRDHLESTNRLEEQVQRAILYEREQCAKVADLYAEDHGGRLAEPCSEEWVAQTIAAIIRARSYDH